MSFRKWKDIEITGEIIGAASQADSAHCMIADAIKAQLPHVHNVSVDLQTIRFSDRERGERYIYLTPGLAQRQLLRFDQGVRVEPWTLKLPTRPSQVTSIKSRTDAPNKRQRPTHAGAKTVTDHNRQVVVTGGDAPPLGCLPHSASHKAARRVFGLRVASGFDPTR